MYEMVVGLETHVELLTESKIFCSCANSFGNEANSLCCPVCIGLPGTLPVLNKKAVRLAAMAGVALNCEIAEFSEMVRKNYIYPDLPKAYQITQGEFPLCRNGYMALASGKKIRIKRIHIEEDAGKLIHENGKTYADYNRAGVPLAEIVTEPDFTSAEEVREYIEKLRITMRTLKISDCKMQEGSLRCDVNISVRKKGEAKCSNRTEIKNINSLGFMVKAINYEFERLCKLVEQGKEIVCETRGFNEKNGETYTMRGKENAAEYRYFPEPDIPPVHISNEEISDIRRNLPELPDAKQKRFVEVLKISENNAEILTKYPEAAKYFERLGELTRDYEMSAGIVVSGLFALIKEENKREAARFPLAENVAEVILLYKKSKIPKNLINKVLEKMILFNKPFGELFDIEEFREMPEEEIIRMCKKAIEENASAAEDYLKGKEKAVFSVVGAVMKKTGGRADAKKITEIIKKLLKK